MSKQSKRRVVIEELVEQLRMHVEIIRAIRSRREPRPGELAGIYLEEEFEEED